MTTSLSAKLPVSNWQLEFFLPTDNSLRAVYGAEFADLGNGNYSIKGTGGDDLISGQSREIVYIIDGDSNSPAIPQYQLPNTSEDSFIPSAEGDNDSVDLQDATFLTANDNLIESNATSDFKSNPNQNNQGLASEILPTNVIDVERDFNGNLLEAIASASQGDTLKLNEGSIYRTSGLTIDKSLIIDGNNSTIDGQGTGNSIIKLTDNADNAIIKNIEITNGNNGISGNGANNVVLENLNINNIGLEMTETTGDNNVGISLNHADGLEIRNSKIENIGRKAVGIGDTNGATVQNLSISNVNLAAQHSQSHDAAGIKVFNTNKAKILGNNLTDINANFIWSDTSNNTEIKNNTLKNVGEDFVAPSFDSQTDINGIYNEKSPNSIVTNNNGTSVGNFAVFNSTEFSSESLNQSGNNFATDELSTEDYWINSGSEKLIALTEDPNTANFELIEDSYYANANIG